MFSRIFILMGMIVSASLHAAEVLRVGKDSTNIAISHDAVRQWNPQDRVCILQRAREVACGVVVKSTSKGAIVRLDQPNYDVTAGDKVMSKFTPGGVTGVPSAPKTQGAPLLNSVSDSADSEVHLFNVTGGVNVGTSFFYPVLGFQMAVYPTISVGVTGFFLTASQDPVYLTAFGGYATVSYYSQEYFRGLWVQGGIGVTAFSITGGLEDESAAALTGLVTAGWRGYWDLGLNIGAGVGLQYMFDPEFTTIEATSTGIKPMITVDIGFNF